MLSRVLWRGTSNGQVLASQIQDLGIYNVADLDTMMYFLHAKCITWGSFGSSDPYEALHSLRNSLEAAQYHSQGLDREVDAAITVYCEELPFAIFFYRYRYHFKIELFTYD